MNLPDDILREILSFLPNEDIFIIPYINKNFKNICNDEIFHIYIMHRKHPMVFNILDNLCTKCNLKTSSISSFMICSHY